MSFVLGGNLCWFFFFRVIDSKFYFWVGWDDFYEYEK